MNSSNPRSTLSDVDRRLLDALLQQDGRVSSRETLMRLAGIDSVTNRRVDVSIVVLRRALGPNSIKTIRQRGWILTDFGRVVAHKLMAGQIDSQP